MALPNKYKGKTFAEAAKDIQSTYKDRFDPISMRGMRKSFESLKAAQEEVKAQQAPQQEQGQQQAPQVQPVQGGQGSVNISQQESGTTFNRAASQSYNEKFAKGGTMTNDYNDGGPFDIADMSSGTDYLSGYNQNVSSPSVYDSPELDVDLSSLNDYINNYGTADAQPQPTQDSNMMSKIGLGLQAAPLIGNIAQLATLERPDQERARTVNTSSMTAALDRFKPRQQYFEDVDMNQIERGITEASGRFTQNNMNASRGNAGAFVANELANQNNLYRNIGQARMQAEMQDLKVDQLNAQENARVDSINASMAQRKAGITSQSDMFNAQMEYKNDIANAQNDAAYEMRKAELWGGLAGSIANIGQSMGNMAKASKMTGYGSATGGFGSSFANGGEMSNGDPTKKKKIEVEGETPGGTTMMDIEPNPDYIYGALNDEGIGEVTRLKPLYRFTEGADISPEEQKQKFDEAGGKDKYDKYRSQFVKQMQKDKVDKSKFIVNDENEVILKDGYIMLGKLDKAQYRKEQLDGKEIIRYRSMPTNKKSYGGGMKKKTK